MLLSIALIMIIGMFLGGICKRIRMPALVGMLITGIILGPHMLNMIDSSLLGISSQLRRIALIIILLRAGITLNLSDLKKAGVPAVLMCFVPACCEIIGMVILAPKILGISIIDAALLGAVVGAVSPAVIVPRMIKLIEENKGTKKLIPQLILAGASVDDVFVIVIFSVFMSIEQGRGINAVSFVNIPVSIILGSGIGIILGFVLSKLFKRFHMRDTVKLAVIIGIAFMLSDFEDMINLPITFSSLVAVMAMGAGLKIKLSEAAVRISSKLNKLWVCAEVMLFALVGAAVDIGYLKTAGFAAAALVILVLVFRSIGVILCIIPMKLTVRERIFCICSYIPKATVQAAIGGVPLAAGLECGDMILTVAVLSIIITAPIGGFLIDFLSPKLE